MRSLRWLLLAAPLSWVLAWLDAPALAVFSAAGLAVVPLAAELGAATEVLAARTGPAAGGLLNATFGNAAELIVAIVALRAGLVDLVKASLIGSILGNLLLILGLALVAGGLRRATVTFNRTAAGMSGAMLLLAVIGLVVPALFAAAHPAAAPEETVHLSEGVAVVLAVTYGLSLVFSLVTHRRLLGGEPAGPQPGGQTHPASYSSGVAVAVLCVATALVALESELLVHATEAVVARVGLSQLFLGLIVIPLIGNAAEHATAVVVARRGQTDLAFHIALGSSTQVALFVAPVMVGVGALLGQPMNLVFTGFEVIALGLAALIVTIIGLDGESHWFEGVQLLAAYALIALAVWFI
ncbi:MAG: calcium/proton exchanger [Gemmatimonadetes bacterium]|nr:MAG: calcium/proton exchanger [Gemmatimonadetes bacterium 13_1_20CM_4_69_16]PYO15106.1 MAG: calcium/proton exchanger [Gemmatimonadota bacterium]